MMASVLTTSYYHAVPEKTAVHTIHELLDIQGDRYPNKEAIVVREFGESRKTITYGVLKDQTSILAAGLIKRGVKKGDAVGLICSTSIEYVTIEFALARVGAILVRIPTSFIAEVDDVVEMVGKSKCRWMIIEAAEKDDEVGGRRNAHVMIKALLETFAANKAIPSLETIFTTSSVNCHGATSLKNLKEGIVADDIDLVLRRQETIDLDDLCGCYATSGSTGKSKLVAWRQSTAVNSYRAILDRCGITDSDIFVSDKHLWYAGGSPIPALHFGCTYVTAAIGADKLEIQKSFLFQVIQEEKCTAVHVHAYICHHLSIMINFLDDEINRIKMFLVGGERMQRPLMRQCLQNIPGFVTGYGCTETGAVLASKCCDPVEKRLQFTGIGCEGEFKVIDDEGLIQRVGTPGELCVRSHFLFSAYIGEKDKTETVFDTKGWFKTKDLAVMDAKGYINVIGRKEEAFQIGSGLIHPAEIESQILEHPMLDDAVVVAIPKESKSLICACVIVTEGKSLSHQDLRKYCESSFRANRTGYPKMPKLPIPDEYIFFKKFPFTSSMKVDRKEVLRQTSSMNI